VKLFGRAEGETCIDISEGGAHRGAEKPNREIIKHSHAYKYSKNQLSKDDIFRTIQKNFVKFYKKAQSV
jgi:hypothetical protein